METITAPILGLVWNVNPSVIPGWNIPRWYGVMWAVGIYAAYIVLNRVYKNEKLPENWMDKTFLYIVIGAVVGARLGHCLFYQPDYYLANPIEILKIWEGGLASHGGILGIIIAGVFLIRNVIKRPVLWLLDRLTVIGSLTGAFIRLGNLLNHEIVGLPTNGPFGFKFLRHDISGAEALQITGANNVDEAYSMIANNPEFAQVLADIPARYPAPLIEAIAYLLIFGIMMFFYWKTNAPKLKGFMLGIFFILLFGARFLIEFIKENQEGVDQGLEGLNMGQYLSIPFMIFGVVLFLRDIRSFRMGKVNYEAVPEGEKDEEI